MLTFVLLAEPVHDERLDIVDDIMGEIEAEPRIAIHDAVMDEDIDVIEITEGIRMLEIADALEAALPAMDVQDPIAVPQRISLSNALTQVSQSITPVTPSISIAPLPATPIIPTPPPTMPEVIQEEPVIVQPAVHWPVDRDEPETKYCTPIHSVYDEQKTTPAVVTQGRSDFTQQRPTEHPFGPLSRATQSVMDCLSMGSLRSSVSIRASAPSRGAATEAVEVELDDIEPPVIRTQEEDDECLGIEYCTLPHSTHGDQDTSEAAGGSKST